MQNQHILVVEDESSLSATIALNLRLAGYDVTIATSGSEAVKKFKDIDSFCLVLLDVMLPDINGFDLCREIKQKRPTLPVIFLTARNTITEKIEGLKLGADDYITKPFDLEELMLRINNLIRRTRVKSDAVFSFSNGTVNFETYEVTDRSGETHTLSRREIGLLKLLTQNAGKVVSRDQIIEELWEADENSSARTIDNYILSFRKLFENTPKEPRYFHTIRGVGYKFTA